MYYYNYHYSKSNTSFHEHLDMWFAIWNFVGRSQKVAQIAGPKPLFIEYYQGLDFEARHISELCDICSNSILLREHIVIVRAAK